MAANLPPNVLLRNAIFSGRGDSVLEVLRQIGREDSRRVVNERDTRTGSTSLHYACFIRSPAVVHLLIEAGADSTLANFAGETPLHVAAARNCDEAVDILINSGCDPNFPSECLQTPLHSCAIYNSLPSALRLMEVVDSLITPDINGMTPLHLAALHGSPDVAKVLLEASVDAETIDIHGRTAVHYACFSASLSVMKRLFSHSADFEKRDQQDRNCLHYLMLTDSPDWPHVFKLLQRTTIDLPWKKDIHGYYPIHYAIHTIKVKAAKALMRWNQNLTPAISHEICVYGATVDPDPKGVMFQHALGCSMFQMKFAVVDKIEDYSVLHYACEWGRYDRAASLLASGMFDVFAEGPKEVTPLHSAVMSGNDEVVQLIMFDKAEIDAKTTDGFTPLHVACAQPFPQIANLLIENKADVKATDGQGRTPLMLLTNSEFDGVIVNELVDIILEKGGNVNSADDAGWTALHYAAARGNTLVVEGLLKSGADPCISDKTRRTALHYAAMSPAGTASACAILEARQQLHQNRDDRGLTALHFAALSGATSLTVKLLGMLENNQQLPLSNLPYHLNPLHLAVLHGRAEVVDAIVEWAKSLTPDRLKPYLTSIDVTRRTPLHHAMKYGYDDMLPALCPPELCKLLLGWQDKDGVTPLSLAAANGHMQCIRYALDVLKDEAASVIRISDKLKRCCSIFAVTALGNGALALVTENTSLRVDSKKRGLLHRAAFTRRNKLLKKLLEWQPTEVSAKDVNGVTPLHLACAVGDVDGVKILLDAGADPVAHDEHGATPADFAAACGKRPVLDFLLHGEDGTASPLAPNLFTSIAVCMTALNGHPSCANAILLEFPKFAKCRDPQRRTPLHLFAGKGISSVVKYLLQCGANVDAVDKDGRIPLHSAATCENGVDCIDLLAENGSNLKQTDGCKNTALHIACSHGYTEVAQALFRHIVEFDDYQIIGMKNDHGDLVLHQCVKQGMKEFLLELLPVSSHLFWEEDNVGRIPLFAAISDERVLASMKSMLGAIVDKNETTVDESTLSGLLNFSTNDTSTRSNRSFSSGSNSSLPKSPAPSKGSPAPAAQDEEY